MDRRRFLATSAGALCGLGATTTAEKTRIGLVHSSHRRLARPSSVEDELDYERVRDMVWTAIEYGRPRAGSLEAKIPRGSWVVIKPNIGFLKSQPGYCPGDVTDLRVTKAVLEYVARKSWAGRISIAEGGSYRGLRDPKTSDVVRQGSARVDASSFDWGDKEFPGVGGSLASLLDDFGRQFPRKRFDYIDLNYDCMRDASGRLLRTEVSRTSKDAGAFGARPDYFVTNTIRHCDFLITVPVMKVHDGCGITACLKNYVGTAPREAYAGPQGFFNYFLHQEQTVEERFDGMIVDLASFHPPDYCVVDGIRGLQYTEHNADRPDQMVRNNLVLAGEDPVAADALIARLMGFNEWDIEHLHMAARREMGTMNFGSVDVAGDEADRLRGLWAKPRGWHGRCNREWLLSRDATEPLARWTRYTAPTDTLHLAKVLGGAGAAAVRVHAGGHRKAFIWVGARGRVTAFLNGEKVMEHENRTRYRIGQFQKPVELRPGENLLVFQAGPPSGFSPERGEPYPVQLSALLVGPRNDGDTVEGIRWAG